MSAQRLVRDEIRKKLCERNVFFSGKPKNRKISKALQHENKNIQHVGYIPRLNVDKPCVKALD
jgi:hypothetical protein